MVFFRDIPDLTQPLYCGENQRFRAKRNRIEAIAVERNDEILYGSPIVSPSGMVSMLEMILTRKMPASRNKMAAAIGWFSQNG